MKVIGNCDNKFRRVGSLLSDCASSTRTGGKKFETDSVALTRNENMESKQMEL
jgi:hypothetical protein